MDTRSFQPPVTQACWDLRPSNGHQEHLHSCVFSDRDTVTYTHTHTYFKSSKEDLELFGHNPIAWEAKARGLLDSRVQELVTWLSGYGIYTWVQILGAQVRSHAQGWFSEEAEMGRTWAVTGQPIPNKTNFAPPANTCSSVLEQSRTSPPTVILYYNLFSLGACMVVLSWKHSHLYALDRATVLIYKEHSLSDPTCSHLGESHMGHLRRNRTPT